MPSHGSKDLVIDPMVAEIEMKPVHGGFRTILAGNIVPGAAGCENIQDAVEETTLISTRSTNVRFRLGKERFDYRPECIINLMKTHAA